MARIRTIKPEFWTSEQVVECSPSARLLFVGLWTFCDDQGVHPASHKRLKMEVFPADPITDLEIKSMVDELIQAGLVTVFEAENAEYWHVSGWKKHQKIDKPSVKHPAPPGVHNSSNTRRAFDEASTSTRRALTPGMEGNGIGEERKGKDTYSDQIPSELDRARSAEPPGKARSGPDPDIDEQFEDWWIRYPNKQGKERAKRTYRRMTPKQRLELEAATSNYLEAVRRGANGSKLKHGSTFINECWRDWVDPDPETMDVAINGCSQGTDKRRKIEEYMARFGEKETA